MPQREVWPLWGPKRAVQAPSGTPFSSLLASNLMLSNINHDLISTCICRFNRPIRITTPMKSCTYKLKRPQATGHLVKSTVDDHDHGRRTQATTTGDGPLGGKDHDHGRRTTADDHDHRRRPRLDHGRRPRTTSTTTGDD
jgi:hypothetical protein